MLKEGGEDRPRRAVTVTHVDLTGNGWASLFGCVARVPGYAAPPASYVYAVGTATGFYEQAFPDASISLAHGAATFHWGSAAPPTLPDACLFPWLSADRAIREVAQSQADADWATILRHRAAELRPGGRFVAALVAAPPPSAGEGEGGDEDTTPPVAARVSSWWRHAAAVWAGLVEDGTLTPAEAAGVVIPVHMSTPAQLAAPFEKGSAAGDAAAAPSLGSLFTVLKAKAFDMPCPQWTAYQASGDAVIYAAALRLFIEAVLRGMQVAAVAAHREGSPDGAASAAAAVDTFYARLEAVLAGDPQPASQTIVVMHLERRK